MLQLNRKLLANGFLSGMGTNVCHIDRKLFADSFLSGMVPLCVIPIGDFSTPLRCARNDSGTWRRCESYRWETVCGRFPVRRGVTAFHLSKKLLVNSFLSGMETLCLNSIGNYLRKVSCSAWYHCVSYRPEISRLRFASLEMTVGRGTHVLYGNTSHTDKAFDYAVNAI